MLPDGASRGKLKVKGIADQTAADEIESTVDDPAQTKLL